MSNLQYSAKPFRVVFLGAPGCGKGTQAALVKKQCGLRISTISTGEMLRREIKSNSDIGLKAKAIIEKGGLVDDDIVLKLIKERLQQPGCEDGFILDGFPRTAEQAEALHNILTHKGLKIDAAILIDTPEHFLMERICWRRVHPASGRTYHIKYNPPRCNGIDDVTGEPLVQRKDDNEDTLAKRLAAYKSQTMPVINYYSKKKLLRRVNGILEQTKLSQEIHGVIGEVLALRDYVDVSLYLNMMLMLDL